MSPHGDDAPLQRTPLYEVHLAQGAKLVGFGGWEMPVSYRGILDEHRAVRTAAGLFDVSHMGEIELRGPDAAAACQRLTTNDVRRLADGHVQYALLLQEDGGVVDDVTLYRINGQRFFFVVNASNIAKDLAWIESHAGGATVIDRSAATALIALQGPSAARILAALTPVDLPRLKSFRFARSTVAGLPAIVSRTGYTGEDGFELYCRERDTVRIWEALLTGGAKPIGLGARDSLRTEMGYALYGNEIDEHTTPLEAGLGWIVKLDKGSPFTGDAALRAQKLRGVTRKLVGFEIKGRGFPRHGYPVYHEGREVDVVRSGTMSPSLGLPIGTTYLPAAAAKVGTKFEVECRGERLPAEVVSRPFWKKGTARKTG
jgi:aminomethyltransferase